jgi:hypothetical protein
MLISFCNIYDGCNNCKNGYLNRLSCKTEVKEGFAFGLFSLLRARRVRAYRGPGFDPKHESVNLCF